MPDNYQKIVEICKKPLPAYPNSHVWFNELHAAIAVCYAGAIGERHYNEKLYTLSTIIAIQAAQIEELSHA